MNAKLHERSHQVPEKKHFRFWLSRNEPTVLTPPLFSVLPPLFGGSGLARRMPRTPMPRRHGMPRDGSMRVLCSGFRLCSAQLDRCKTKEPLKKQSDSQGPHFSIENYETKPNDPHRCSSFQNCDM